MNFTDELAIQTFGITIAQAHKAHICIKCKKTPMTYSGMGDREYLISGLCEYCFDLICDPEKCQNCQKPYSFHTKAAHELELGTCNHFKPMPSQSIGD